jgi:heme exporter protein C
MRAEAAPAANATTDVSAPRTTTASPRRRDTTGTRPTRILGVVVIALMALLVFLGLVASPQDIKQGDAVRLLYLHVPAAEMTYVAFAVAALCSAGYLWRRTRSMAWDRVANASVEIGVVLTALMLVTGSLWGRLTWSQFWVWDARVTSSALLFVMFLGYLAVRTLEGTAEQRARRSAVVCLIAILDVPLVHYSVDWFRTVHQRPTFVVKGGNIEGIFRFTHFVGFTTFLLAYIWLLLHRNRVAMLEELAESRMLETAIAERQREGLPVSERVVGASGTGA